MPLRTTPSFRFAPLALAVALVPLAAACDKKDDAAPAPTKSGPRPSSSTPTASSSSAPAGDGKGLSAKDNDPKVIALVKPALGCGWDTHGFKNDCEEWKKWREADAEFKGGAGDATLVNLIEDVDEKVRYAGAFKLDRDGSAYRADKALATRTVAAAEAEKTNKFAGMLGGAIAEIAFDKTGLWDRVKALATTSEHVPLRSSLVGHMLKFNADFSPAIQLAMDALKDKDDAIQSASIKAFDDYHGAKKADACKDRKSTRLNSSHRL